MPPPHLPLRPVVVPARGSQSASRVGAVLSLLAEIPDPLTLTEIATCLGLAKSSALPILVSLEEAGLVRRIDNGYQLDYGVVRLAGGYLQGFDVISQFRSKIVDQALLSREMVQLAAVNGRQVTVLARHAGRAQIAMAQVGDQLPAALAASGRAVLAELRDEEIQKLYARPESFEQWTPSSPRTLEELMARINQARARGYSVDDGETHSDVIAWGVALRSGDHRASFGLAVSVRRSQCEPEHAKALVAELVELRDALQAANHLI